MNEILKVQFEDLRVKGLVFFQNEEIHQSISNALWDMHNVIAFQSETGKEHPGAAVMVERAWVFIEFLNSLVIRMTPGEWMQVSERLR